MGGQEKLPRCPHVADSGSIAALGSIPESSAHEVTAAKGVGPFCDWAERLEKFPQSQFVFSKKFATLEEALVSGPGLLDLFSGARGFARCFVKTC